MLVMSKGYRVYKLLRFLWLAWPESHIKGVRREQNLRSVPLKVLNTCQSKGSVNFMNYSNTSEAYLEKTSKIHCETKDNSLISEYSTQWVTTTFPTFSRVFTCSEHFFSHFIFPQYTFFIILITCNLMSVFNKVNHRVQSRSNETF